MLVSEMEYSGYHYRIYINKGDRRENENKFRIEGNGFLKNLGYFEKFDEAETKAKEAIDGWVKLEIKDYYKEISNCIVRSGYEDCELDKQMVMAILEKHKQGVIREYRKSM